ncbi:MAG TPA: hypothetical protein PK156_49425 [Polyangium sp.]|nr:hypothetical protein [Polyangium sp.]
MKRNAYLMVTTALVVGLVNGCDINPFAPPDEPLPGNDSSSSGMSSSGNGGNGSGGMGSGGGAGCKCADDGNECTVDVPGDCPNGDPTACHLPAAAGTACAMGVCNGAGQCGDCTTCTEATCLGRCNGIACTAANQCTSGLCEQSTCCEAACSGPCQTCSKDGVAGTCTRMPVGLQVTGCDGAMICDANGACVAKTMAALGTLCNTSSQCMSGVCRREYCQSPVGEPCVEDLECTTNLCDPTTKTCKSCTGAGAGTCTAGSSCDMATGNCKVFLGQPAGSDAECVSGTVIQFLCSLPSGAACTAHHDCVGRNCVNGVCTAQCSMASQCADGGPCSANGVCGMVPGEYCVVNEHCKSGNCSGFPRRCQ